MRLPARDGRPRLAVFAGREEDGGMKVSGFSLGLLGGLSLLLPSLVIPAEMMREEIPSRYAPADLIKNTLKAHLSPEGRFVLLPAKGTVLVIDEPARVRAAAEALEKLEIPPPRVRLSLGLETGGRARPSGASGTKAGPGPVQREGYLPFPTRYSPPRISGGRGGGYVVVPAHPTGFRHMAVGQRMEVTPSANPDGSVAMEVNAEEVEFSGFVSYGSPILAPGVAAVLPLAAGLTNAADFLPYAGDKLRMPVTGTTRVSTSVAIRPELDGNLVRLHFQPRLMIANDAQGGNQAEEVLLPQFASQVIVPAGKVVRLASFASAPPEFNQLFFGSKDHAQGLTRMAVKAEVSPGEVGKSLTNQNR